MKKTFDKFLALLIAPLLLLSCVCFNVSAFAAQEAAEPRAAVPTITAPTASSVARADLTVKWTAIQGATYIVSLRDLSTNMLIMSNSAVPIPNGASFTIQQKYFYEGHQYRVAVGATVSGVTTWAQKDFKVNLSSARQTFLSRAAAMNNYTWTPTKELKGWNGKYTFNANTRYTGIPYTQYTQCSITTVSWVGNRYFNTELSNSANNGFYTTQNDGTYSMPTFGNDCSGYASIVYNIARENTNGLAGSRTSVGYKGVDSKLQAYARLSPGDIIDLAGSHVVVVKDITAVNNSNGSLDYLSITTVEQTPGWCQEKTWTSTKLIGDGYVPLTKDASTKQDYSWKWVA